MHCCIIVACCGLLSRLSVLRERLAEAFPQRERERVGAGGGTRSVSEKGRGGRLRGKDKRENLLLCVTTAPPPAAPALGFGEAERLGARRATGAADGVSTLACVVCLACVSRAFA